MEEEILTSEDEETQAILVPKILKKRIGNKLYLANKGCTSLIGCIEKIGETYFIEGYFNPFKKESEAVDYLLYGIC